MRKILLVASVVILVILTGCTLEFPTTEENKAIIYKPIPKPDEVQYYNTIEEAVAHNTLDGYSVDEITEPIKLFRYNNLAVFFFKASNDNEDFVYVYKHYVTGDADIRYSPPVMATKILWIAHKNMVKMFNRDAIGEVLLCIECLNTPQFFSADRTKTFVWGLSQTEKVSNLKIEGQPVTAVIEVELDGEKGYFWYFDDLKTEKLPILGNSGRYYKEGLVITME